jgi:hypothetical protein
MNKGKEKEDVSNPGLYHLSISAEMTEQSSPAGQQTPIEAEVCSEAQSLII